jgi:hypothetical protein
LLAFATLPRTRMATAPDLWLLFGIGVVLLGLARTQRLRLERRPPPTPGPRQTLPGAP